MGCSCECASKLSIMRLLQCIGNCGNTLRPLLCEQWAADLKLAHVCQAFEAAFIHQFPRVPLGVKTTPIS